MNPVNSTHEALINAKNQLPISRVTIFDTCKTVPSKGFNVYFYTLPDSDNTTLDAILNDSDPFWYAMEDVILQLGSSDIIEYSTALAFDWGVGGSPSPVSQAHLFGIKWTGYFYARYTGVYRFYIDSSYFARLRIKFNGSYLTFKDPDDDSEVDSWDADLDNTDELYADTASLTAGDWYAIQIEFAVGRREECTDPTYLCVKYKEPTSVTTGYDLWGDSGGDIVADYPSDSDKKVLSAGVVNTAGSFLSGDEITDIVKSVSGGKSRGESAQYQFDVAVAVSTWLTDPGGVSAEDTEINVGSTEGLPDKGKLIIGSGTTTITYTNKDATTFKGIPATGDGSIGGSYVQYTRITLHTGKYSFNPYTKDFGIIKPYRLVKIELGHRSPSTETNYYSNVVWGHIFPNPQLQRSKNEDILTIYMQDFNNMLGSIQQNYPDNASYSGASYYNKLTSGEPDGQERPVAYDRWKCEYAVRDIYIKANIDPILTYQRKRLQVTGDYAPDYGGYLIDADFQLNYQPNYGNPGSVDNPDDKYLWFFGYGKKLIEMLASFAKTFGRRIGFDNNGFAKFSSVGLPTSKMDVGDAAESGTWSEETVDFDTLEGHYKSSTELNAYLSFTATGSEFILLVGRHSTFGGIKLEVDGGVVTVIYIDGKYVISDLGVYDLDYAGRTSDNPWFYYEGVDSTGNNPSEIRIKTKYDYGVHTVKATVQSDANVFIDGLLCYDNTLDYPVRDIETDRVKDNLNTKFDIENTRNEMIVVGALQGLFQNSEGQIVNPNNPIYLHLFSKTSDVYSIYDSSNIDYVGRKLPFEIYDPKINSQEWADYISTQNVIKYRSAVFQPSVTIDGDMRLEPGDCITVKDLKTKTTTDSDNLWVEQVRHDSTIDKDGKIQFITGIETVPRKPVKSFERRPALDLSDWHDEPIINIELRSQGKRISGNDVTIDVVGGTITIDNDPDWDTNMWAGYLFVVFGTVTKSGNIYPVLIDSIASNTSDTITLSNITITDYTFGEDLTWCISFDPFDTDQKGSPLEIHYDQLITGIVEIYIVDEEDRYVALVNPSTSNEIVEWGSGKVAYWSGVFEKGEDNTNYYVNDELFLSDGILKRPLSVMFQITDIDTDNLYKIKSKIIDEQYAGIVPPDANVYTALQESDYKKNDIYSAAIFPYIINSPPILYLEDEDESLIINSGRIVNHSIESKWVEIDNDINWVEDESPDDWVGKTIFFSINRKPDGIYKHAYNYFKIDSTSDQGDGIIRITIDAPYTQEGLYEGSWTMGKKTDFYYAIFADEPFSKFDSNDNSFNGLSLHIVQANIYVDGDFQYKKVGDDIKVTNNFKIIYNDIEYSFSADDIINFCCFSNWEYDADANFRIIFWNKYNPTKLYYTYFADSYTDVEHYNLIFSKLFNPRNGLYPIYAGMVDGDFIRENLLDFPIEKLEEAGIYCNIERRDFSIFDGEVHEWDKADDSDIPIENFPKSSNIKNIYVNPENNRNAFRDLPYETDKDTEYMGRLFVFDADFRDRAGRYAINNSKHTGYKNWLGVALTHHRASLFDKVFKTENIKIDSLPVVWHPLTNDGTKLISTHSGSISSPNLWGIQDILVKLFKK